ncbi:MAG: hypothetical protein OCD76_15980 [Reichenbachiella sp.]
MRPNSINLFDIPFELLLEKVSNHFPQYEYDYKRHIINLNDPNVNSVGYIRMPLHLSIDNDLNLINNQTKVIYLTIESGNAAISVLNGKTNIYHTTFSAYMTRKKQGVSQIKYLNKKGKSRAGSRMRLAGTFEFFEKINAKLIALFTEHEINRIALDCSTTLIPYLYNAKIACPYDKKDARLYKIPLHLPQSNYTNLERVIKKLIAPTLFYDEQNRLAIEVLVEDLFDQ